MENVQKKNQNTTPQCSRKFPLLAYIGKLFKIFVMIMIPFSFKYFRKHTYLDKDSFLSDIVKTIFRLTGFVLWLVGILNGKFIISNINAIDKMAKIGQLIYSFGLMAFGSIIYAYGTLESFYSERGGREQNSNDLALLAVLMTAISFLIRHAAIVTGLN